MINRDYILRMIEQFGRALAIILRLRKFNRHEEALIHIEELFLKHLGLTSSFINSLPEELLIKTFSPMGTLNINACLWAAVLLKAEGEIYEELENATECYYHYLKSLHLFLAALLHDRSITDTELSTDVETLLQKLEEYELPNTTKDQLFTYYEHVGQYAKAEDILFELLDADTTNMLLRERGQNFYMHLLEKSATELAAGNLTREEVVEGLTQLRQRNN